MDMALQSKFQRHASIAKKVPYASYCLSDGPMISEDYRDCNGVVILGKNIAALSHFSRFIDVKSGQPPWFGPYTVKVWNPNGEINYHEIDPKKYVERMLEQLESIGERKIQAVLIGGDPQHFKINRECLEQRKVQIIGHYLDGWEERNGNFLQTHSGKNLVVLPSQHEVILYSDNEGYKQLA
jgi:hypothetical protein